MSTLWSLLPVFLPPAPFIIPILLRAERSRLVSLHCPPAPHAAVGRPGGCSRSAPARKRRRGGSSLPSSSARGLRGGGATGGIAHAQRREARRDRKCGWARSPAGTGAARRAGCRSWQRGARSRSRPALPWASCRTRCAGAPSPAWCCASTRRSGEGGAWERGPEDRGSSCRGPSGCSRQSSPAHRHHSGHQAWGSALPSGVPGAGTRDPGPTDMTPPPPQCGGRGYGLASRSLLMLQRPPPPLSPQCAELRGGHRLVPGAGFPAADPAHLHVGERHRLHYGGGAIFGRRPCPELCPGLRCSPQEDGVSGRAMRTLEAIPVKARELCSEDLFVSLGPCQWLGWSGRCGQWGWRSTRRVSPGNCPFQMRPTSAMYCGGGGVLATKKHLEGGGGCPGSREIIGGHSRTKEVGLGVPVVA